MVRRHIKPSQFWEVLIVIVIVLVIIYRLALVYDFVPDAYQPSTMLSNLYDVIKKGIVAESTDDSTLGHTAKWTVDQLNGIEKYFHDKRISYIREQETADRCKENMIFRYFMFMGDEDNPNCSESNMQLNEATKEIFNDASKHPKTKEELNATPPAGNTTTPAPAPATAPAPAPAPQPTTINVQPSTALTPEMLSPKAPTPIQVTPAPAAPAPTAVTPTPAAPAPVPVYVPPPPAAQPAGPGPGGRQPVSVSEPESVPAQ